MVRPRGVVEWVRERQGSRRCEGIPRELSVPGCWEDCMARDAVDLGYQDCFIGDRIDIQIRNHQLDGVNR